MMKYHLIVQHITNRLCSGLSWLFGGFPISIRLIGREGYLLINGDIGRLEYLKVP